MSGDRIYGINSANRAKIAFARLYVVNVKNYLLKIALSVTRNRSAVFCKRDAFSDNFIGFRLIGDLFDGNIL